ncbi:unnamed protein product [Rhodiola kirilowii]
MTMELLETDVLTKVALFLFVQLLVYFILSTSSEVFSKDKMPSSFKNFRPARSVSIRRLLAAISELPSGGEPSPSFKGLETPTAGGLFSHSTPL